VIWALLPPPHWELDEEVPEPESLVYFVLDYDASQVKIGYTEALLNRACGSGKAIVLLTGWNY